MDRLTALQLGEFRPVKEFLGKQTLDVLAAPDRVESYIIEDGPRRWGAGFVGCTILAEGPLLTAAQLARLRECVLSPEAHYNGRPIFKRLPSVPNFAFRVWRGDRVLDLLLDLHNPGWEFFCGPEHYRNWNWVGREMVGLAKELFLQFASPSRRAVWRKGAIRALQEKARAASGK
jgi:hypothetical protein